jgi:hypothetical protein
LRSGDGSVSPFNLWSRNLLRSELFRPSRKHVLSWKTSKIFPPLHAKRGTGRQPDLRDLFALKVEENLSHHAEPAPAHWKLPLHADFASLLSGAVVLFAVTGALLALLCITMGSWHLLHEARTPLQHSPSRYAAPRQNSGNSRPIPETSWFCTAPMSSIFSALRLFG